MKTDLKITGTIAATLIKPENPKGPLPSLIFIHGWRSDKEGNTKRAQEIAKLGYICLCIDLRGHGESDGSIEEFSRKDHLEDIKAAYKYLSEIAEVDKNKIGIVGSSYGGYLAAVAANYLKFNSLVLRVSALYFDDNFEVPTDKLIKGEKSAFKTSGLTPENSLAIKGVANFSGNILIVEAGEDKVIPHDVIENYIDVIEDKRKLTYVVMKNAPHSLETEAQEKEYIEILKTWLQDKEQIQ